MASSPKFRRDLKAENGESLDVTQEEATEMLNIIKSIAHEQRKEMPGVALKAAQFIFNEGKGRNNIQGLNTSNLNVIIVNQKLQGMRAARERVLKQASGNFRPQESVTVDANEVAAWDHIVSDLSAIKEAIESSTSPVFRERVEEKFTAKLREKELLKILLKG